MFHKENGGVSSARNVGLKNSRGRYITFIDSDDSIEHSFIEHLLMPILQDDSIDFVQAGCSNIYNNEITSVEQKYNYYDGVDSAYLIDNFRGLTFSKIFVRNRIVNDDNELMIAFDENITLAEDMVFTLQYLLTVSHYVFVPEVGYLYRRDNMQSITKTLKIKDVNKRLYCWKKIARLVEEFVDRKKLEFSSIPQRMEVTGLMLNSAINTLYVSDLKRTDRLFVLKTDFEINDFRYLKYVKAPSRFQGFLNQLMINRCFILYDVMRQVHSFIIGMKSLLSKQSDLRA